MTTADRLDLLEHFYGRVVDAIHALTVDETTTVLQLVEDLIQAILDVDAQDHCAERAE